MVMPSLGSSRQIALIAALSLWLAVPVSAQPVRESLAVEGQAATQLVKSEPSASRAHASQSSLPTYTRLYRPELFLGWARASLGPSKTDLGPAWSNLGGGIGARVHRRIGVEFELNQSLESPLRDVDGLHQGVTSMTFGSAKALVYLATGQIQPYLGVGLGLVWEDGVGPRHGGAFSAGIRVAFTHRIFVKSEFGAYAGLVQRGSVAGGYQF
jgi:opacity protein-like surface antigen